MRRRFDQATVAMLVFWIGVGVVVHQMALEPSQAYILGSFSVIGAPLIGFAFGRRKRLH
jgi:hypothetical protein